MATKERRARWFFVQRSYYFDTHDAQGNWTGETEDQWKERVKSEWKHDNPDIKAVFIAFIFHDRDTEPDTGAAKGLHAHALIHLESGKTITAMMAAAHISRAENCEYVHNIAGSAQYLIHVSPKALKDRKTIYLPDAVMISEATPGKTKLADLMAGKADEREARDEKEIKEDWLAYYALLLMRGEWTLDEVQRALLNDEAGVGFTVADWKANRAGFEKDADEYIKARARYYITGQKRRGLALVYLEGRGGDGKTTLANALAAKWADSRGIHLVAAPGERTTFDFAGTYKGQKVSLFNECGGSDFSVDQFCSIFDPKFASLVNSRNEDKGWTANYCIITTARSIEGWIRDAYTPYAKERIKGDAVKGAKTDADWDVAYTSKPDVADKIRQLRRRFAVHVRLAEGWCYVSILNEAHNTPEFLDVTGYKPGREPFTLFKMVPYSDRDPALVAGAVEAIDEAVHAYYATYGYDVTPWMADGFPEYLDEIVGKAEEPKTGLRKRRTKATPKQTATGNTQAVGQSSDSTLGDGATGDGARAALDGPEG